MSTPVPMLIVGDAPSAVTGLGRITRDLAVNIHEHMSDVFDVACMGYGGIGDRTLPFPQYTMEGMSNWFLPTLPEVWKNFADERKGVVFTIWDASRLLWFARPDNSRVSPDKDMREWLQTKPFERWGYFPMDALGPHGRLSYPLYQTITGYDKVIAYSEWARKMIEKTFGHHESEQRSLTALPHGIHTDVFKPRVVDKTKVFHSAPLNFPGPRIELGEKIIGIVATNQIRKDYGLAIQAVSEVAKDTPVRLFIQTDVLERHWSIPTLLYDYGLMHKAIVNCSAVSDEKMAQIYSACDLTLGIGAGEGFGYPIFESLACFPAGTMVTIPDGEKTIESIQPGDIVISHKGRKQRVLRTMSRDASQLTLIQINGEAEPFACTPEHPFLISRFGKVEWCNAENIQLGDFLIAPPDEPLQEMEIRFGEWVDAIEYKDRLYPAGRNQSGKRHPMKSRYSLPITSRLSPSWGRLLGYWLAEGWAGNGEITFSFGWHEQDLADDCSALIKECLGVDATISLQSHSLRVNIGHSLFARLLVKWFGSGALNKTIPHFLMAAPIEIARELLRGMWAGDGTVFEDRKRYIRCSYCTSSSNLARQVRRLLVRFGIASTLSSRINSSGFGKTSQNLIYQVRVTGKFAENLGESIGENVIRSVIERKGAQSYVDAHGAHYEVKDIKTISVSCKTYNLSVEEDESYLVNGIAVHNCGTPCVTGDYGGQAEWMDKAYLLPPKMLRIEGLYNCVRPVFEPSFWARQIKVALGVGRSRKVSLLPEGLDWTNLWPKWEKHLRWLHAGMKTEEKVEGVKA